VFRKRSPQPLAMICKDCPGSELAMFRKAASRSKLAIIRKAGARQHPIGYDPQSRLTALPATEPRPHPSH
jgi:hypothetical protein